MGTLLFLLGAAGFLTGGAIAVVRRTNRSRKGWFLAVLMAAVAALLLFLALNRMGELS